MEKEQLQGVQDKDKNGKIDLKKGLNINKDETNKYVAVDYVIDTNKRSHYKSEPKMTD